MNSGGIVAFDGKRVGLGRLRCAKPGAAGGAGPVQISDHQFSIEEVAIFGVFQLFVLNYHE
jgi:hypothetical protein